MSRIVVDSIRNSSASSDGITLSSDGKVAFPNTTTGKILQVVQEAKNDTASESTTGNGGISGDLISKAITPSATSSKVLIRASIMVCCSDDKMVYAHLFKNGSVVTAAIGASASSRQAVSAGTFIQNSNRVFMVTHEYLDSPNTTSATTYSYRFSHDADSSKTIYLNRSYTDTDNDDFSRGYSSLTLTEVAA